MVLFQIVSSEEFHIVHASSILTVCLQEISKNMSLFTFTNASVEPPKDMIADICPSNCNFQGDCVEGILQAFTSCIYTYKFGLHNYRAGIQLVYF